MRCPFLVICVVCLLKGVDGACCLAVGAWVDQTDGHSLRQGADGHTARFTRSSIHASLSRHFKSPQPRSHPPLRSHNTHTTGLLPSSHSPTTTHHPTTSILPPTQPLIHPPTHPYNQHKQASSSPPARRKMKRSSSSSSSLWRPTASCTGTATCPNPSSCPTRRYVGG